MQLVCICDFEGYFHCKLETFVFNVSSTFRIDISKLIIGLTIDILTLLDNECLKGT